MALTQVPNNMLSADLQAATPGFKNRIINGAMAIWQRGTSFSISASTLTYTADRFWAYTSGAPITVSQVAASTATQQYALKLQRNAGSALAGTLQFGQVLESANSRDLAGSSVTLTVRAKAGANYSGGNLTIYLREGTGNDESANSFRSGGWTGSNNIAISNVTLTTSMQTFTLTGTASANASQIGFSAYYTPTGTAGADDSVTFEFVQIEKGSTATAFDYRSYGTELALCQRYYYRTTVASAGDVLTEGSYATSTTNLQGFNKFPVSMRTSPAALEQSGTAADYRVIGAGASSTVCSAVPAFSSANTERARTNFTVASGLVVYNGGSGAAASGVSTSYLGWSAEL